MPHSGCLLYTSPRIRGFVISAKLLSVVACGYAFHSVIPFMPGSDFLNFFF
ncbi:RNA pseudouridine synthase, partial [Salmonella enterica subsp. enterica serovar Kentucky]|nr:RNA pseudouridine synthase [Salmonella enterica subsp. enterica serovar Kentucky]ECV0450435.1 RNA pseudouridine synthase [Salmonella enterica subsp. enterica serovar Kentucky]